MTATPLDPRTFPLRGSRLIEASAGTGKTWTIAALYLRLVLGHGGDAAFARPLTPPEILVVTFTEAATKELRERIRARLAQAARYFDASAAAPEADDFLRALRADHAPEQWPSCARRLQLAAEWMDEAAVSTIHGWCNRMLREHAFDSASLFTQRLEPDQRELLHEAVRDYWRTWVVPLDLPDARQVACEWTSPAALFDDVKDLLRCAQALPPAAPPAQAIAAVNRAVRSRLAQLKAPWPDWCDELRALFDDAAANKRFAAAQLNARNRGNWLDAIAAWATDAAIERPTLSDAAWKRLTTEGIAEIWKNGTPPAHPAFAAFDRLRAELAALPTARVDLLRHAARAIVARFATAQDRQAEMGFDELLTRLDAALAGPNGPRLAASIRAQFPVALIDEFQDTDAIQYRIFDAVYRIETAEPDTAIVLIGDPKQAIYAFRGADIYTYLEARRKTIGRQYTLSRNYRSTPAQVDATNRCFAVAEQREPRGAFRFRRHGENPVPFVAASAEGRVESLVVDGRTPPALTLWRLAGTDDGKPWSKGAYLEQMAEVCATEMVRLLDLGCDGAAGFAVDGSLRALRAADLAVLVNSRDEAAKIRAALDRRGVRSVYLSDRESVFARPEAGDLQSWLEACAEPDDGRAVRAALATRTLGLDWATLDHLHRDEIAWDDTVLRFRGYRECWQRQGVLPMLRRLLHDYGVPTRLLAQGSRGERSLTDVLHLAELLQQASALLDGEHALIRHLADCRADPAAGGDATQVRLESDADLVQVVTVHKAKGLEYPLVFLPFACTFRLPQVTDTLQWHDDAGRLQVTLDGDPEGLARADDERLGEDLRKLYVALTRARHATWVGVAPVEAVERSAFGYLVGGDVGSGIDALAAPCPGIAVIDAPEAHGRRHRGHVGDALEGRARELDRPVVREHWWIASYSALLAQAEASADGATSADTSQEDQYREGELAEPIERDAIAGGAGSLHGFPAGADTGLFFHGLLEWAAGQGFATVAADAGPAREFIAQRCAPRGWERWIDPLTAWLRDFVRLPLAGTPSFTLAAADHAVAEMEFWIAVERVDLRELDRLITAVVQPGAARPALERGQLNGMLKGFIDLIVEHRGRYYVVDYKSNRLGEDDAAYTAAAMARDVLLHRYDLQYVLYLLALHRLLKLRLPDYDYDQHVGGALYLYLRGSAAASRGIHADRPPRALIEALDRLFAAIPAEESA